MERKKANEQAAQQADQAWRAIDRQLVLVAAKAKLRAQVSLRLADLMEQRGARVVNDLPPGEVEGVVHDLADEWDVEPWRVWDVLETDTSELEVETVGLVKEAAGVLGFGTA